MSVIIDVIGATIAGSLLVLTILATIFNVHEMNYNIQMLLAMNHHGKNVQHILDTEFIEKAGQFLAPSTELPIFSPHPDSTNSTRMTFHFWDNIGRINHLRYSISTEEFVGDDVGSAFSVQVHRINGFPILEYDSDPFFLASDNIFTYFGYEVGDENGNGISNEFFVLDIATLDVARIRAVRVDLVFHTLAFDRATGLNLVYPLSFWRIFTNAYILNNVVT